MSITIRVVLDERDFRELVRGKIVDRTVASMEGESAAVQIALQDVGFDRMIQAVQDAWDERNG